MAVKEVVYSSVALTEICEVSELPVSNPPKGFGARHMQALILFLCLTVGYGLRAHLSVTMVAMTAAADRNTTCFKIHNNSTDATNRTDYLEECDAEESSGWSVYRSYNWDKPTQEMILYSFFVGYTGMMMPMGVLAQTFGGKIPIMVALGANGVLTAVTPWVPIFGGWLGVCAVRLLQGATQAAFYPSIHTMLARWAPLGERGRLSTYVYTGSQFGTVLAFQLAGLFAGSPRMGWPATFWLAGAASLACLALLACLGAATPHQHRGISADEMAFIMGDLNADVIPKIRKTPWRQIVCSAPVWALVTTHAGSAVGYLLILTQIPQYMNKILGVDIQRNGVFSSLPYIAMYFTTLLFGVLNDFFVTRKIMSVINIRRVSNSIGMASSGLVLVAFSYVQNTLAAVVLLVLSLALHSGVHVGFHINHIDLAPNFAGPIMALGNTVANLSSLMAPVLVSNIVGNDVTNQHKWQIVFIIVAAVMVVTNVVFVALVKATVQPWNFHGDSDTACEDIHAQTEKNNGTIDCDIKKKIASS